VLPGFKASLARHNLAEGGNASKLGRQFPRNLAPDLTQYLGEHTKENRNL
jgi:hypothetical protein